MKYALLAVVLLVTSSTSAQNIWQMNAAYQGQINQAQQSAAMPYYYAPVYRPYCAPRYVAPISRYDYGVSRWSTEQDQLREMRKANLTLRMMEWDLQDMANEARFR